MNAARMLCLSLAIFFGVTLAAVWAQERYVPKPDEELYGTWVNDKSTNSYHIQKAVNSAGAWKEFTDIKDSIPRWEGTMRIDARWGDAEGNIWYRTFNVITAGSAKGIKAQTLYKISKSGTVEESLFTAVGEFDPKLYPTEIDPQDTTYKIFYRAEEASNTAALPTTAADWTLVGSWINKAYESSPTFPARVVFGVDGTLAYYQRLTDRSAVKLHYDIDASWVQGGAHWFKIRYNDGHNDWYRLVKLTDGGNVFDSLGAVGNYPPSFDTSVKTYYHESRQRE